MSWSYAPTKKTGHRGYEKNIQTIYLCYSFHCHHDFLDRKSSWIVAVLESEISARSKYQCTGTVQIVRTIHTFRNGIIDQFAQVTAWLLT